MQAVVYTRISKDRAGAGLGVERQEAECRDLASRLGWTIVDVFSDNDISAYSGRTRPGYDAMCAALEAGKAHAIVAWHTDRLHRRPVELESFIDLCDRRKVDVKTVQSGDFDLSTASGKMIARMLGAAARHEVEHSIERAKSAKKQAAVDGKFRGGRRSFGYEKDGLTECKPEADAIRSAVEKLLAGASVRQVARDWNAAGLRTSFGGNEFNSREVRKVVLRPRNAGIVLHEGKRIGKGAWDAILDEDTFAALEALLRDPERAKHISYVRKYQGSGVYVCGVCGATMGTASQVGSARATERRKVYSCSQSKHLGRVAEFVDEYVSENVIARLSDPAVVKVVFGADVDVSGLHAKRDGLRARRDELGEFFGLGRIDGAALTRGTDALNAQIAVIDAQLTEARAASELKQIAGADDIRKGWEAAPPDVRGKVIDALMTVTILPAGRGRQAGGGYFDPTKIQIDWKS